MPIPCEHDWHAGLLKTTQGIPKHDDGSRGIEAFECLQRGGLTKFLVFKPSAGADGLAIGTVERTTRFWNGIFIRVEQIGIRRAKKSIWHSRTLAAARQRTTNGYGGKEETMGLAAYDIVGRGGEWHVEHDGLAQNTYQTKEAAFEAAIAAASLAMRQGHAIRLTAPESENAVGAANSG